MTTDETSDFSALKSLATHLLRPRYACGPREWADGDAPPPVEIVVRAVPETFPADVTLFPDGSLLGTVAGGERMTAVMHTDVDPEQVVTWYRDHLGARGWREPPKFPVFPAGRGGFVAVHFFEEERERAEVHLCRSPHGPSLQVVAERRPEMPTTIELQIDLSTDPRRSSCAAADRARRHMRHRGYPHVEEEVIPAIKPPPRSRQMGGGGGGSEGEWHSSASVRSPLGLQELARHYDGELEAGGWQRRCGGVLDEAAWSRWSFTPPRGRDGLAYLFIFAGEGAENRYQLELRAMWTPEYHDAEEDDFFTTW